MLRILKFLSDTECKCHIQPDIYNEGKVKT